MNPATLRTVRRVGHVMNLPVSLAIRGRHADDDQAGAAWAEVMATLREVDTVFSTYRPDSFVSRLGRGEITPDDCPPEVAEVLALGELAERQSQGAFQVRRARPGGEVVFDPTGVVKGWAVEHAADHLRALESTDFCLSAGGDLVGRVVSRERAAWRIGIEHPLEPRRLVATVPVRSGAVATSGTAHRGQHLRDARTGRAAVGVASMDQPTTRREQASSTTAQYSLPSRVGCSVMSVTHSWSRPARANWRLTRLAAVASGRNPRRYLGRPVTPCRPARRIRSSTAW